MKLSREEMDALLLRMPAFRRGDLSPAEAHKISLLLEEDDIFAAEARREELIVSFVGGMKPVPLPRGLVARSIRTAVGNAGSASWFSIDSILIALGVGAICAGSAQFFTGTFNIIPAIGQWLGSIAGVLVDHSISSVIGTVAIASLSILLGGIAWAFKLFRS